MEHPVCAFVCARSLVCDALRCVCLLVCLQCAAIGSENLDRRDNRFQKCFRVAC